ncbi:alpha-ketoglutarate dependent xanthine dioxygenase [Paraphaeosphaeria sporulosa]|uniref:Alpha-ketoglutarate dependent xanthine dioxygenase n=1 Tax=Paraphaeosphaeria sporulosa TaxID=1460663 RepID=A0A177CGV5_9PLEO|nr:alpha-ketoglutarate dependent xanthine dioxygenase [Paraphaeosphaeria sporulosa]OAG06576.1 alpha-ketoglutarate dependent xanthine dioxygenase [Paraphaeosphaeria sporulosa]
MPHPTAPLQIRPLPAELRKSTRLGAEVVLPESMTLFDPKLLSETDQQIFRTGFFDNGVLVIRDQTGIQPHVLYDIADLLDPDHLPYHSGGQKQVTDSRNILSQNNCSRIPRAPQVTVIGSGHVENYEGIGELDLQHLDQSSFHEYPLSEQEIADGLTRPYRWHMDAALYENLPGIVTSLHAIEVPKVPKQRLQFPQGEIMDVAAGATLFFSGARNFDALSPEEQEFALNTTVHYAPRAYEMIRNCKASSDGLTIENVGRETLIPDLPPFDPEKVHSFPMVWTNPSNGLPHLQIAGCCVYSLTTIDPSTGNKTVVSELAEVRRICHELQEKVYRPENVYAHSWQKGDLVIFHNRGVMHSISGQLAHFKERRLLWQCNMASSTPPKAYRQGSQ